MKSKISLFIFLIILSCGVRQDGETFKNVLIGSWGMQEIKCYFPDYSTGNRLERFILSSFVESEIVYTARSFNYAVTETTPFANSISTCITAASGNYVLSFVNETKGTLSYRDIVTGAGCSISMTDTGGAGTIDVPYGFSALSGDTQSKFWTIDENNILIIELSTGFKGSSNSTSCSDSCKCYGFFEKNTTSLGILNNKRLKNSYRNYLNPTHSQR